MSGAGAQPAHRAEQEHGEQVGGAARHRDDERTERLRPVEAPHAREEAEEPPGLGARLGRDRGHGQVGRRGRLLATGGAGAPRRGAASSRSAKPRVDAERVEHAAERGGEAAGVLADVEARGVQPEGRRLDAHRLQVIGGDLARDRSRDHVEHLLDRFDRDARPVRRLVEQPRRHVLLRRRLEVGGEQRQREAIGLAAVAPLEIRHVRAASGRRASSQAVSAGGAGQRRPLMLRRRASSWSARRCRSTASPRCRRSVSAVTRRHHRRVAVAVAADPRGQREPAGPGGARPG